MERLSLDGSAPGPTTAARVRWPVATPAPPPLARWRSETQTHRCQKEEKEPAEPRRVEWPPGSCQKGSLGRGQAEGGQRVGGLCDKSGARD